MRAKWGEDLTGRQFGRLKVLRKGDHYRPPRGHPQIRWICVCTCGNEVSVLTHSLRHGKTKSCGCLIKDVAKSLWSKPDGEASFNQVFLAYRQRAARKGQTFNLSAELFKEITQQNCRYCGEIPLAVDKSSPNGQFTYNGLDRVYNSKGYEEGNVVACCAFCNRAKRAHTVEYFEEKVRQMYQTLLKKEESL